MIQLVRSIRTVIFLAVLFCAVAAVSARETGVLKVVANGDQLQVTIARSKTAVRIVELQPFEIPESAVNKSALVQFDKTRRRTVSVPRFDGARDRLYSAFVAVGESAPIGAQKFVEEWKGVSRWNYPYPQVSSKKGLQVQMLEDAIELGVKHAALNFNLAEIISLDPQPGDIPWEMDGRTFHFRRGAVEGNDRRIKTLSDRGMVVSLIILYYKHANPELNRIMLHPNYDDAAPNRLTAFNTTNDEGLAWFKACMEFTACRYSQPDAPHGRVVNYIIGNEVNSHWMWYNMGRVSMEDFAKDYARTMRVCDTAVRKYLSTGRVFISLEHHWGIRYASGDEMQTFAAKPFIDYFAMLNKTHGDFPWHVAFHPYPENLFNPRTWNDKSAEMSFDTPRITFKNLEVLPEYLKRKDLLYNGKPRRIILSEQGFHSRETEKGELLQAAAYCYAYYKTDRIDGIDSFILHRHVDHAAEGGLNLGLWRRSKAPNTYATPESKKPIYEVFKKADTPEWREAFEFALPVIGIERWEDIAPKRAREIRKLESRR